MAKYTKICVFNASPYKKNVYELYTKREREIYYNTHIRKWEDHFEVRDVLGVQFKDAIIIPDCYKPLYNKLCKDFMIQWRSEHKFRKERKRIIYPSNRYMVLRDYGDDIFETLYIDEPFQEQVIRKPVVKRDHFPELLDYVNKCKFDSDFVFYRNSILLKRLREKIYSLYLLRCSRLIQYNLLESTIKFQHNLEAQMDTISAQGEKTCPEVVSQGNTLQETQRGASVGKPAKFVNRIKKYFNRLASAESSPDYATLTDRFFPHGTYDWKGGAEHPSGKNILSLKLPYDFVVSHQNAPNCTLFNSYSYWDGDLEVKIMVNSNKFQVGQLQVSWYYGQDYENNFERRDNIYTASQQAHCLVSASTSNEGVLYIPFRYYKPKMGCKKREDDPGYLNMGSLNVRVINELSSPSTTYKACTFTISFRFVNSNFSGMISRDLGSISLEPNMFAVRAAMRVLEELNQDPQRDNPPVISPPNPIVPWSAHSWCIGDVSTEPTNVMRLSAPGQTPHPAEVTPEFDEMSIKHVVSIFGLVNIKQWNASDRTGTLLFKYDGCPVQDNDTYYRSSWDNTECYAMPPVAVVSNLFAYWRGSLELRLDVIASPFHTGRLLIAYIPRVMDCPSIEQAKGSPHMIIDLQGENRQYVFRVPYIADRPWWHNRAFGSSILPPSRVYCFVLNELVPMDNVINTVDINIYMRGCDDFEVSVPVSPRIGLSTYNALVRYPRPDLVYTLDGYTPMYVGSWRYFEDGKKKILRYGNVSDHVVQFKSLKSKVVYVQDDVINGSMIYYKKNGVLVKNWWIVGIKIDNEYKYATIFTNLNKAKEFASKENNDLAEDWTEDSDWFVDSSYNRWDGNVYFKPIIEKVLRSHISSVDVGKIDLEANMDERESVTTSCQAGILNEIMTTNSGLETFGESFDNLKTLCRRYQLYAMIDQRVKEKIGHTAIKIPILPQGLVRSRDDIILNDVYNMNREGVISVVASGYRFYRGGIRIRIVWKGPVVTLRIEHRPDERLEDMNYDVCDGHRKTNNDGYASCVQNTGINNVMELELPWYQCGILGLLQNPKLKRDLESYHFSLGNLYISILDKVAVDFKLDIYYKLADDCRFSVFQGFPMMMWAPNMKLEAQMGLFSDVTSFFSSAKENSEKIGKIADKLNDALPDDEDPKASILGWISSNVPKHLAGAMVNGISQIFHCFINPSIKTVAWAVTSFMASIGVLCTDVLMRFSEGMVKLLSIFREKSEQASEGKQLPDDDDVLEAQMNEQQKDIIAVKAGIISTVISSICASLGAVGRIPRNVPDFLRGIWNNIGKFSLTSNALCTFFKNNLIWITNCYKWVVAKICPSRCLASELEGADEDLKSFVAEALELTSAVNERKVEIHPKWNMRVYKCAAVASTLYMRMSSINDAPRTPALFNLMSSVLKLRDKLVRFQLSPPVRFEPFVLCFAGSSNIGKSHICQEIAKHTLKDIDYKTYYELIYTRTPGNPYWNQLRGQPVCLYDDFCAIGGEHGIQQAAELFCLKSRAIFNPPQAEISDKYIRYNPLMVLLATNQAFPKVAGVENNEAFYRRRDMLVEVRKNVQFYLDHGVNSETGSPKDFRLKDIKNFEHLLFRVAIDVKNPQTEYSKDLTYLELVKYLNKKFRVFYSRELELYKKSLDEIFEFYPDDADDILSIKSSIKKHNKKIDDINKYRFGSIEELRIMCMQLASTVKVQECEQMEILMSLLKTYSIYDKKTVRDIVTSNEIIRNYGSTSLLWKEWYDTLDCEVPSTSKDIDINEESPILSLFEGNMDEIPICPHMSFTEDYQYVNNEFFNPGSNLRCSESACKECLTCPWLDEESFKQDMQEWKDNKFAIERQCDFRLMRWEKLPKYFRPKSAVLERDIVSVNEDVDTWLKWSKRMLASVGSGLWSALKWALRAVIFLCSLFGIYHMISDVMFPEDRIVRCEEKLLAKQIPQNKAMQQTFGKMDAELMIQKELINKTHFTQQDDVNNVDEANMVASGDFKTFGKKQPQIIKDVAVKMIANMHSEKENAVIRLLKRNSLYMEAHVDNKILIGRILGLIDHYALCVDHYNDKFSQLPENQQIFIVGNDFRIATCYSKLQYKKFDNSSLGYIKLPVQIPPFRNLLKHIARQKDHRIVGPLSFLVETNPVESTATISEQYCERINNIQIPASNGFSSFYIPDGYKYARGGRGVCGSALVSTHLEHPIYGIHVAGDVGGRVGISEAITYEQFEHLIAKSCVVDVMEGNMYEYNGKFIRPNSHHVMLGILPHDFGQHETGKSKVIPTECNNEIFENYCAPPVLTRHDERIKDNPYDPLQAGIDKHGMVPDNFPEEIVDLAADDLNNLILAKVKPIRNVVGKLDVSVAVVGDNNILDYDKLDFNTSEGFPYVSCRPKGVKSKLWLLDLELGEKGYIYKGCDTMLTQIMVEKEKQRLNRELPFTVFIDCLKDRKLPISKATTPGKVRIFSISPLDFTIQCRQYFLDFNVAYKNSRLEAEHAIGIDVNSLEWTSLVYSLINKGNNIVTADYSNYGPTLMLLCAKKCIRIIRNWYKFNGDVNQDNDIIRELMGYELMFSIHLARRTVYRTLCGLPSGSPMTVILNTLVGSLYVRVAWKLAFTNNINFVTPFSKLSKEEQCALEINNSFKDLHKHVKFVLYGDDIIKSVTDSACEFFNCLVFSDILNYYNISVKNATKDDNIVKYRSLLDSETTFLKCQFIPHPSRLSVFLAGLDKNSVEDTCNWTFKEWEHKLREISLEACDACIRNAFGWGPNYFNFIRNKVIEYWLRKGEVLSTPTWLEIDEVNYS